MVVRMPEVRGPDFLEWADTPFPFSVQGTRYMLMVATYLDASTTHDDDNPIFAVAGYVSTNLRWYHDFSAPWTGVLAREGLEYFHMTDFENRQGPYRDWDDSRRERVITELLDIIGKSVMHGVGAAVVLRDFEALSPDDRAFLRNPNFLCTMCCAQYLRKWISRQPTPAGIAYVCESGEQGEGDVGDGLRENMRVPASRVLSVTFAGKEKYPQLQSADILAYETAKQALRSAGLSSRRNVRKSMRRLLKSVHHDGGYFDADGLRRYIPELRAFIDAVNAPPVSSSSPSSESPPSELQ